MKQFLSVFVAVVVTFVACGLSFGEAEARRLGGGSSFGMQRSITPRPAPAPARQATPAPTAPASPTAAPAPKRNWLGPIAGLAAGIGIASLLSHFGLGEEFASIFMIALLAMAVVFVLKLLMRRAAPSPAPMQYAGMEGAAVSPAPAPAFGGSAAESVASSLPPGFDGDAFLRVAKLNFVRLQAANDARNLDDMREFVSPEVFAEIKMQMDEHGNGKQQTDVVTLNAELLEVVTEANRHIASVRFNGMIRETEDGAATPFDEVWNLSKPADGSKGWVVSGIQQVN